MSGYERTATKEEFFEDVEKTITKFKWVVMVINVLTFFIGMATFSLCMWIRFDLDFWEWVIEIDWYSYWYATYLIMIAMVGVVINSVLGVWSVVQVRDHNPYSINNIAGTFYSASAAECSPR